MDLWNIIGTLDNNLTVVYFIIHKVPSNAFSFFRLFIMEKKIFLIYKNRMA